VVHWGLTDKSMVLGGSKIRGSLQFWAEEGVQSGQKGLHSSWTHLAYLKLIPEYGEVLMLTVPGPSGPVPYTARMVCL
jgi:hypothetical protein